MKRQDLNSIYEAYTGILNEMPELLDEEDIDIKDLEDPLKNTRLLKRLKKNIRKPKSS